MGDESATIKHKPARFHCSSLLLYLPPATQLTISTAQHSTPPTPTPTFGCRTLLGAPSPFGKLKTKHLSRAGLFLSETTFSFYLPNTTSPTIYCSTYVLRFVYHLLVGLTSISLRKLSFTKTKDQRSERHHGLHWLPNPSTVHGHQK